MQYTDFRDRIHQRLKRAPMGLTWTELREDIGLPYVRACPTWTRRLEHEIGLTRTKGSGRALVWRVSSPRVPSNKPLHPPHDPKIAQISTQDSGRVKPGPEPAGVRGKKVHSGDTKFRGDDLQPTDVRG